MGKKKKYELPETAGKQLHRMNPNKRFDPTDDSGRDLSLGFNNKYDGVLKPLTQAVGVMIAQRNGNEMLLMDAALLGICAHLRDAMAKQGVQVLPEGGNHG